MDQTQIRLLINVFYPSALCVEWIEIFEFLSTYGLYNIIDISAYLPRENSLLKHDIKISLSLKVMKFIFKNLIKGLTE